MFSLQVAFHTELILVALFSNSTSQSLDNDT